MRLFFSVVIPAWNEERNIHRAVIAARTAFRTFGKPFEIIVVDDGSADRTAVVVRRLVRSVRGVRLVAHARNRGKGAAVCTGVQEAKGEWVLILDADLATTPQQFKAFLPVLPDADIVIGSRRVPGARILRPQWWVRGVAGRLFNWVVRRWFGFPYRDTQCGFKAFRRITVLPLFQTLTATGWSFDVDILVRAQCRGLRIQEVPVRWRDGQDSRVRWSDAGAILRELWRIKRRAC